MTVAERLRFWFGFQAPVARGAYFRNGLALALVKYGVDVAVVRAVAGRWWSPLDYFSPVWSAREQSLGSPPDWLLWALVAWTLPFLWIGLSMTMRRAVDAGVSPWTSLAFFVPVLNYLVMAYFSLTPSAPRAAPAVRQVREAQTRLRSAMIGIAAGLAVSVPTVALHVLVLESYSAGLFLGTPFALGSVTAYFHQRTAPRGEAKTLQVVTLSLVLLGGTVVLFALEGLFCVALAFPLALGLALVGAAFGTAIAGLAPDGHSAAAVLAVVVPLGGTMGGGATASAPDRLREVVTAVEVAAPPERVWPHVVRFSELPPPTHWLFRVGVAYPRRARIEGEGVGAVRRCEFSTGPFVEPITAWEAPFRLAFDVAAQPIPLEEWSPYRRVYAAHLHGGFLAARGEFRLVPLPAGRTRLEGSTWYRLTLAPTPYWRLFADAIVHRIHLRVLGHVRALAEAPDRGREP